MTKITPPPIDPDSDQLAEARCRQIIMIAMTTIISLTVICALIALATM